MKKRNSGNLGATSLRAKRRFGDPMDTYDTLPAPLRQWLSQAVLPWSPTSAKHIWLRARAKGHNIEDTLESLSCAQERMLARDACTNPSHTKPVI